MKTCNKCNKERAPTEFKTDPRNKDGLQGICKLCNREWQRERRAKIAAGIGVKKITEKRCNGCGEVKLVNLFYKDSASTDTYHSLCKVCRNLSMNAWRDKNRGKYNESMRMYRASNPEWAKDNDLRRCYGIGLSDYNRMLIEQNNVCKLCSQPPRGKRPLVVDHNHGTGEIRGLLCYGCNRKIVILEKSAEEQQKAIDYVKGKISS